MGTFQRLDLALPNDPTGTVLGVALEMRTLKRSFDQGCTTFRGRCQR